jgi:CRP-like cAMP-binding protein
MATDPKWAALRAWHSERASLWREAMQDVSAVSSSFDRFRERAQCHEAAMRTMTRLSRQRPKTGAKQR